MKITLSKGIALGTLLVAGLFLGCRHEVNKTQQGGAGAGGAGGNAQYNEPVRVLNGMIEADQRTVPDRLIDVGDKSTWLNIQGVSSNTYRIPSLIKVAGGEHKGKLYAVADARWGGSSDLNNRADTWGRTGSVDATTWGKVNSPLYWDVLNCKRITDTTFDKNTPAQSPLFSYFGDPSLGSDAKGTLYAFANMGYGSGLQFGKPSQYGSPYIRIGGEWYLILRANKGDFPNAKWDSNSYDFSSNGADYVNGAYPGINVGKTSQVEDVPSDDAAYTYAVKVTGGPIVKINRDASTNKATIDNSVTTNLWMDADYMLYKDASYATPYKVIMLCGNGPRKVETTASEASVHCHIVNALSPFQTWRGGNMIAVAKSTDAGANWSRPRDITYMVRPLETHTMAPVADHAGFNLKTDSTYDPNMSPFSIVSPSHAHLVTTGKYKGRLVHNAYSGAGFGPAGANMGSGQNVFAFWTDDGETWYGGDFIKNQNKDKGETAIVETPDGTLLAVNRDQYNGSPTISVSTDGGDTWTHQGKLDEAGKVFTNGANVLPSAINLYKSKAVTGESLVAVAVTKRTSDGTQNRVYIAALKKSGERWIFDFEWNGNPMYLDLGSIWYSNMAELENGDIAIFYEGPLYNENGGNMDFAVIRLDRGAVVN